MSEASAEGAAAAAGYFLSLYPYVYATGGLSAWDELAGHDCAFCNSTRDGATQLHQIKGHRNGGGVTVEQSEGLEIDPGRWYAADLVVTEQPSSDVDQHGVVIDKADGGRFAFHIAMTFDEGRWVIDAAQFRAAP